MPSNFSWTDFFVEAGIPPPESAEYALIFADHRMQADMVPELTKDILHDLGITLMGDILAILRQSKVYMQAERRRQQAGVSVSQSMLSAGRIVPALRASQTAAVTKQQQQQQNVQTSVRSSTSTQAIARARSSTSAQSQQAITKSVQSVSMQDIMASNSETATWLRPDVLPHAGASALHGSVTSPASSLSEALPKRRIVTRPRATTIGTELPESHIESNRSQTTVIRQASEPDSVFDRLGLDQSSGVRAQQLRRNRSVTRPGNSRTQSFSGLGTILVKDEPVEVERVMSLSMSGRRGHTQTAQRTVATATSARQTTSQPVVIRTVALQSEDLLEEPLQHGVVVARQVRTGALPLSASEPPAKRVHFDEDSVRKFVVQTSGNRTSGSRTVSHGVGANASVSALHRLGNGQPSSSQSLTTNSVRQKQSTKANVKARLGSSKSVFSRLG